MPCLVRSRADGQQRAQPRAAVKPRRVVLVVFPEARHHRPQLGLCLVQPLTRRLVVTSKRRVAQ
eukprot:4957425-Prymnesium_polylepis.1